MFATIKNDVCPFCASSKLISYKKRADQIQLKLCKDCGLIFVAEFPSNQKAIYGDQYYKNENKSIGYDNYESINFDYFIWATSLISLARKKGRLFDIGAGNGLFLDQAKKIGFREIEGTEFNDNFAKECLNKGYNIFNGSLEDLDTAIFHSYDIVTAWAVLEHIPALAGALDKISNILENDGLFFFEVPYLTGEESRDARWFESSLEHIHYFSHKSLTQILNKYFGNNYFFTEMHSNQFGSTAIGIASKSKIEIDRLNPLKEIIFERKYSKIDLLKVEDLVNISIILLRYFNNFEAAKLIIAKCKHEKNLSIQEQSVVYSLDNFIKNHEENIEYLKAINYERKRVTKIESDLSSAKQELAKTQNKVIYIDNQLEKIENSFSYRLLLMLRIKVFDRIFPNRIRAIKLIRKLLSKYNEVSRFRLFDKLRTKLFFPLPYKQTRYNTEKPLISVIIPCFNYGQYLTDAVNSVLSQTFQNFEIIIVESGSTDNSQKIIESFTDSRIVKLYRKDQHLVGDNRNYGIAHSNGRYICCLDADDKLNPTYLEEALFLLESQNYDLVSTSISCFGLFNKVYYQIEKPTLSDMILANHVSTVAVFKKSLFELTHGYHDWGIGEKHVPEDWNLWVEMSALGARFYNIREPRFLYRIHVGESLTNNSANIARESQRREILRFNKTKINGLSKFKSKIRKRIIYIVTNPTINISQTINKFDVLLVLPFMVMGGADAVFLNLFKLLAENNIKACVVTTNSIDIRQHSTAELYKKYSQHIFQLPDFLNNELSKKNYIKYLLKSREIRYAVQGGSQLFYDSLPDIKSQFPDLKVVDVQFNTDVHFKNNRKYATYIDKIIAENKEVYQKYLEEFQVNPNNISLIPYAVDIETFNPSDTKQFKRPSVIPEDKFVVSFIGRLSPEKNPEFMIKLAERMQANSDIFFIVAGPGPLKEKLTNEIEKKKLKNIALIGVQDTKTLLAFTGITVVPSIIDGNPIIIKESFSMGVPVVASNVGAIQYIIKNGNNGYLCEAGNMAEFENAIKKIYGSESIRNKLKLNSREYAIKNFNIQIANRKLLEIFDKYTNRAKNNLHKYNGKT